MRHTVILNKVSINSTNPRTNPWNFHKKYWELAELENDFFLSQPFWVFFSKKKICFISMKTSSPFILGIIYFCTMDGFFRILEENLIRTNMHTTVWGPNTLTNDTRSQNSNAAYKYLVFCRISSENYKILACFYLQKTKIWMLP